MAILFGTAIYDGRRCKIFTITMNDNDGAGDFAVTFTANNMTAFQGAAPGIERHIVCTASVADTAWMCAITACTDTVCTFRKVLAAGAANAKTMRVTLRFPRGIGA